MKHKKQGIWNLRISKTALVRFFSAATLSILLTGCGGGGGNPDSGDDDLGPIIVGTGVTERALARDELEVKASSGEKTTVSVDTAGNFNARISGSGPYLSRLDLGNNEYLYGIGYVDTDNRIKQNVHGYSDLIIRNWFAANGTTIDDEFESASSVMLPSQDETNETLQLLNSLLALVMDDYSVAGTNLLNGTVNSNTTNFILQNPVIINNNTTINIFANDNPAGGDGTQTIIINGIDLTTDFTATDTVSPSVPGDVRAIAAGGTDIVIVWSPSTDNVGVAAYRVFRDGVDIGETPYPVLSDSVSSGASHVYTVIAIDAAGNESGESAAATISLTDTIDTTAPPAPTAVTLTPAVSSIAIGWQQSSIEDVAGFMVFGAEASETPKLVATVTSTFLVDSDVASGTEYCYQVVAVDASENESAPTELLCTTTSGSVVNPVTGPVGPEADDIQITFAANNYEVLENQASVVISVERLGDSTEAVSVDYTVVSGSATDGEDFTATSGTLTWAAGDSANQTITVQIAADTNNAEGDETFTVVLSNASGNAVIGSTSTTVVTISDVASQACTTVLETTVLTADTVLNLPCYLVNSTLDVREPANLTIQPGVTLKFSSNSELLVRSGASLTAVGSSTSPILLTGQDQTPGFWRGVNYNSSNSTSNRIEHTVIEYGGGGSSDGANLNVRSSRVRISNTTMRYAENYGFSLIDDSIVDGFDSNISTSNNIAGIAGPEQAGVINDSSSFTGNTEDRVEITRDVLERDATWADIGVPWLADGVDVRAVLTLRAGVDVQFDLGTVLVVRSTGQLVTEGTVENPVLLTGKSPSSGYWEGVRLDSSSGAISQLRHTTIEFGGSGFRDANLTTGINSRIDVDHVTLRSSSGDGFYLDGDSIISRFDNVVSTSNVRSGSVGPNVLGEFGSSNSFVGNSDDTLFLNYHIVDDNQTWPVFEVPLVFDDLLIRADLVVSPGTTLLATADAEIKVQSGGSLRAEGTADANIVFSANQAISGVWKGIFFSQANSANNVFDHVVIEYGGFGLEAGNITTDCGQSPIPVVTLSNILLANSGGYGIYLDPDCLINVGDNVTFSGNAEGPGITTQ